MVFPVARSSDIFIVDDDASVRDSLALVVNSAGYNATTFADGEEFLGAARATAPACIILDLHMPGRSGVALLKELNAQNYPAPIFIVSGDDNIGCVVEAIKNGAFDYIVKPFDGRSIVARLSTAMATFGKHNGNGARNGELRDCPACNSLTARESEVLVQIASGASNKETGRRLGVSHRTIEVHRAHIMQKLGARNATDLMRIVLGGFAKRGDRVLTSSTKLVPGMSEFNQSRR